MGSFLETFVRLVQQDYLVLTVDDQVLEPNKSSVTLDANQKCPPGSFSAIQFGYCGNQYLLVHYPAHWEGGIVCEQYVKS